jgi:hypothetical protein
LLRRLLYVLLGDEILDRSTTGLGLSLAWLLVHLVEASEPSNTSESIMLLLSLELRLLLLHLLVQMLLLLLQVSQVDKLLIDLLV